MLLHVDFKPLIKKVHQYYQQEGTRGVISRSKKKLLALLDLPWVYCSWILPGPANKIEIRTFAIRRSGHHAIINWLRYQIPGRYMFLNDCLPNGNPFITCNQRSSINAGPFAEHKDINWKREAGGKLSKKGVLIYNYEDCNFAEVLTQHFIERKADWLGTSHKIYDILILRDPFNLFASKLRWAYGKHHYKPDLDSFPLFVNLWKEYANEYLGNTAHLNNKIAINYNQWFSEKEYRKNLSKKLGFKWHDKGLYEVAKWGPTAWGDSFDGLKYNGRANQMKVLERWKKYLEDPFYRSLFQDNELIALSNSIFGHIPGTEKLLNK